MAKESNFNVSYLANLARIALADAESAQMQRQLKTIVNYVNQLQVLAIGGVEPTSQVTGLTDVWRKDEVKPSSLSRTQLLANAPAVHKGYIKVPRVL